MPLIPAFGLYGAAAAVIVAPGLGAAAMLAISQRSDRRLELLLASRYQQEVDLLKRVSHV